jgi:threonine/homoserine/homoserine lactone efflux protein
MPFKIFAGIVAATLLLVFIGPVVIKLKDLALTVVAAIGFALMFFDLWQSLRSKDD